MLAGVPFHPRAARPDLLFGFPVPFHHLYQISTRTMSTFAFGIAFASLNGIIIAPLLVIGAVSYFVVRHDGDPLRRPFYWMKAAYPLLAV